MANINMASIMKKINSYAKSADGKEKISNTISKYRQEGRDITYGGGRVTTVESMAKAAETMISILKQTAASKMLPQSVLDHFNSLSYSQPEIIGKEGNQYKIDIFFTDDLSRPSLTIVSGAKKGQRTGEGVKNIVSLFDTGYDADKKVYGLWEKHENLGIVSSVSHRDSLGFMKEAVEMFNRSEGISYNAVAYIPENDIDFM